MTEPSHWRKVLAAAEATYHDLVRAWEAMHDEDR
jgi:hypothetical protein